MRCTCERLGSVISRASTPLPEALAAIAGKGWTLTPWTQRDAYRTCSPMGDRNRLGLCKERRPATKFARPLRAASRSYTALIGEASADVLRIYTGRAELCFHRFELNVLRIVTFRPAGDHPPERLPRYTQLSSFRTQSQDFESLLPIHGPRGEDSAR